MVHHWERGQCMACCLRHQDVEQWYQPGKKPGVQPLNPTSCYLHELKCFHMNRCMLQRSLDEIYAPTSCTLIIPDCLCLSLPHSYLQGEFWWLLEPALKDGSDGKLQENGFAGLVLNTYQNMFSWKQIHTIMYSSSR